MSTEMAITMDSLRFKIGGMDCAGCARSVESAVSKLEGVAQCELNFTTETLFVTGEMGTGAPEILTTKINDIVGQLGFTVINPETQAESKTGDQPGSTPEVIAPQTFWRYLWQRPETRLALVAAILPLARVSRD